MSSSKPNYYNIFLKKEPNMKKKILKKKIEAVSGV